jgi:hypothetical protein
MEEFQRSEFLEDELLLLPEDAQQFVAINQDLVVLLQQEELSVI